MNMKKLSEGSPMKLHNSIINIALTATAILLICSNTYPAEFIYPSVESNIPARGTLSTLPYRSSDHKIAYGLDPLQFGELWLPTTQNQLGLLILVHGGCWSNIGRINSLHAASTALSQAGFAVWSIEYRASEDSGGGWPGTYNDVISAINFVEELSNYGVSIEDISLIGHSAGGHLVTLAGTEHDEFDVKIDKVISLAGINKVVEYADGASTDGSIMELCQNLLTQFVGGTIEQHPLIYEAIDPARKDIHPQTYLFVSELDDVVPVSQGSLGGAETIFIEGAGHSDYGHPGTLAFSRLKQLLLNEN